MASETSVDGVVPEIRGLVLVLEDSGAAEAALGALSGSLDEDVRRARRRLEALPPVDRGRVLERWRAQARCPWATVIAALHPSWAEEALAGEPDAIVAAVRGTMASEDATPRPEARELARLAFCRLTQLDGCADGPLAERLCAMESGQLLEELTRRGAHIVGRSLAGATPALRARAMARAGEPWAQEIARGAREAESDARPGAAAFVTAGTGADGRTPAERLLAVGLAEMKARLEEEGRGSLCRVAGRLPAALGRVLVGW